MATVQRKLVHKQFNSPIGLYSENNVKSTLNRELKAFSNGTMGVECDDNAQPANLANSAVLKFIQEEERKEQLGGVKRVTWPPEHEYQARAASQTRQSQPRQSPAPPFHPSQPPHSTSPSIHYQHQQHQNGSFQPPQNQNQYRSPSYQQNPVTNNNNYPVNQSYQQQSANSQQPNYQRQISERSQYPTNQTFNEPEPTYLRQEPPNYLQSHQTIAKPSNCTAAFAGGISVANKKQTSAPDNRWSHVKPSVPVHSGYVQPSSQQFNNNNHTNNNYNQQTTQYTPSQNQYNQNSQMHTEPPYANQYHPQPQQSHFQQPQQPTQQYQNQQYQSVQPHQQQQYQPVDNFYRQPSPGVITLRKELPITQKRPPIYASEPAAYSFGGGGNMRGDNKWPPEEYKKQSEIENEQRRQLALGPAFRPRRVNKDYTGFFQRHALSNTYPGYRAPPGTQHYGYQYPQ